MLARINSLLLVYGPKIGRCKAEKTPSLQKQELFCLLTELYKFYLYNYSIYIHLRIASIVQRESKLLVN